MTFLRFLLLKDFVINSSEIITKLPINVSKITNYLFFQIIGELPVNNKVDYASSIYKDQYKPMRKGITNMIELHTTGAVAMPIEIRLHIVASSKDVIHS